MFSRLVRQILVLVAISIWSGASGALAVEFPWLEDANTQMILLSDPRVDFALRVRAIDRAKHSIDSITYVQGTDPEIGLPILNAFRRAAQRGVPTRFVTGAAGGLMADRSNLTRVMLTDSNLAAPVQLVLFGGFRALFTPFQVFDMPHEKILIIDAGTPDEVIWIGGRNNYVSSGSDLDLGLLVRPIDPSRPYIGDQIKQAFEFTWEPAARTFKPYSPKRPRGNARRKILEAERFTEVPIWREEGKAELEEIDQLLRTKATEVKTPNRHVLTPRKLRIVTNDFMQLVLAKIYPNRKLRHESLPSDIIDEAAEVVAKAKKVYISTMSVFVPQSLKDAIKTALRNGAEVNLLTNGRDAHRSQVPLGLPYDLSLSDINEFMAIEGGKLNVYLLDVELLQTRPEYYKFTRYMHRKLIIADDYVLSGSDNFNDSSRKQNSEIAFEGHDAEFANKMRELIRGDLDVFRRLSCEEALTDLKKVGIFQRSMNTLFKVFY